MSQCLVMVQEIIPLDSRAAMQREQWTGWHKVLP